MSEKAGTGGAASHAPDSPHAWMRLAAAVLTSTIGGVGMWSFIVALPAAQTEFAVDRAAASLPFTLAMFGFAVGGVLMGWLSDRFGIIMPVIAGAVSLALGYIGSGYAPTLWLFAAAHILIGFGSSATLGPLMSDMSHWFVQRRGLAVTICSSGNYVAGTIWPAMTAETVSDARSA